MAKNKNQNREHGGGAAASTNAGESAATGDQTPGRESNQAMQSATEKAGQIVEPIKRLAFAQLDNQKAGVLNRMYSVTTAIRQFDDQLREQNQAEIAQYGDQAARQIERLTGYLQDRDAGALLTEAGNFAKRRPLVIVGAALALGLIGGRLLKNSGAQAASGSA